MVSETSPDITEALAVGEAAVGKAILALRENQWFDRKSARVSARRLVETLCAFANGEGGTVVIGLNDGHVEGIAVSAGAVNEWRQAGMDHCEPAVRVTWRQIACRNDAGRKDHLLVGDVGPSSGVHATKSDAVFLRVGDENRRLSFSQRQELVFDKGQSQFDGTGVQGASVADLDDRLITDYAALIGSSSPARALQARGLSRADGAVTVAGLLMFGREPQSRFPSAYVRVLRYRGLTRETGSRQQIVGDERCEGPVPLILTTAAAAIERLQPQRRVLGPEGRFILEGLIPRDAWLEGLVNAVVHRSYSLGGDHIRVEIYDDRIEVTSPGSFPGLTDPMTLPQVTRFARNPRIARGCADLQFGQELGEGIRRMFDEMRARGLADPLYVPSRTTVRLVLNSLVADGRVLGQFSPEYLRIVDVIRQGQRVSTGEVAEAVGVTRPTAINRLKQLQNLGVIDWVGKSPSDPRAFWRLRSE